MSAPAAEDSPAATSVQDVPSFAATYTQRLALRAANMAPALRNEPRDLKSDLKKGTAFAKKIRSYACENEANMLNELKTYNLKMFVKETAQGIGAALFESAKPLRTADVTSLAVLCSGLHQRYDEFLAEVLVCIKKGFDIDPLLAEMVKKFDPSVPHADVNKIRSTIRFMCEWWLIGLVPDAKFIIGVLQRIVMALEGKGSSEAGHLTVNSLNVVNIIIRTVGIEIMGAATQPLLQIAGHGTNTLGWSDADGKTIIVDATTRNTAAEQCEFRKGHAMTKTSSFSSEAERSEFSKRVSIICEHAVQLCTRLKKGVEGKWRQICEQAELRGDPTQEAKDVFHQLRREVERIYVLTENLLTSVGRGAELPAPLDLTAALQKSSVDTQLTFTSGTAEFFTVRAAETMNYYDDDEQRTFYEDVAPIDHLIPPMEDGGSGIPLTYQQLQRRGGGGNNNSADGLVMMDDTEASMQGSDGMTKGAAALPPEQRKLLDYSKVDSLLVAVHRCSSLSTAQKWLEEYLEEATKYYFPERLPPDVDPVRPSQARAFFLNCKMMLLVELRYEPDRAQELIPYLARVAAGMHSRFPEFGEALARQLENHIFDAIRNKRPNSFHSKLLNTRYLCELMKFRVCPPIRVIRIVNLAVEHFEDEHCVLMCAIVVQHGASFLFRGGVTKVKIEEALQKMKQAEKTKGIPSRAETEYEHAWAELRQVMNPHRNRKVYARVKTPLERYLGNLVYVKLEDSEQSYVEIRQRVLKMPWNGMGFPANTPIEDIHTARDTLVRVFRKAHHIGYDRIHLLVELIADVTRVHGSSCLLQPIVDHVLEDARRDLEAVGGGNRSMQKRLQDMKFMSELYNFKLIPLRVIAFTVSLLMLYKPCGPIHPRDYTRLRCALQLLRHSSPYFLRKPKVAEKQMTRQLLSLVFCHIHNDVAKPLPMDLDYCLEETLIKISKLYDDTLRREERRQHRHGAPYSQRDLATKDYYFIANFPRTAAKAQEYAEQVKCESVAPENEYFEPLVRGITSVDAVQHFRCFPVLSMSQSSASSVSIVGAVVEPTRRTAGPRVKPAESKRVEADRVDKELRGADEDDEGSSSSSSDGSSSSNGSDSDTDGSGSDEESSGDSGSASDEDDNDDDSEDDSGSEESDEEDDSSDEDDLQPKLGPLANARLLNQRCAAPSRGTTNDEDNEFDAMFRDAVKESSNEGARRTANKTTQQHEKIVESRMASINVTSMAKQLHQDMSSASGDQFDATNASIRLLASHQKLKEEEMAQRKRRLASGAAAASTEGTSSAPPAAVSAFRVTVLRRAPPPTTGTSGTPAATSSSVAATRAVEGKQLLIPMDSEFAQRSQAFVAQSQRDRALIQERTIMMLRQHEEEEARSQWPVRARGRGGRGGRGGGH